MEEEELQQPIIEEQTKQVSTPRVMEEMKLQQFVNTREEFYQEPFEEEPICSIIL